MVRTTGLKVLHGMFSCIAGPQGLTSDLCAQLVSVSRSIYHVHVHIVYMYVHDMHIYTMYTCGYTIYHIYTMYNMQSQFALVCLSQALYDYRPSLVDAQLLQAWLTVLQSAYIKLHSFTADTFVAHLPRLFTSCMECLLSDKDIVKTTASSVMEVDWCKA